MTPDPREEKLPVWAAAMIERLRSRVNSEHRRAEEARLANGPADSRVLLDPYEDTPIPLPENTRIRFVLAEEPRRADGSLSLSDYVDISLHKDPRGYRVEAMAGGSVLVRGQSSNVVTIDVENRY